MFSAGGEAGELEDGDTASDPMASSLLTDDPLRAFASRKPLFPLTLRRPNANGERGLHGPISSMAQGVPNSVTT